MSIGAIIRFSKAKRIILRDNSCCRYCGKKLKIDEITFDHVIPKSKKGKINIENLAIACRKCNTIKGEELMLNSQTP